MKLYKMMLALFVFLLFTLTGCGIMVNTQNIQIDPGPKNESSTIANEKKNINIYTSGLVRIQKQNLSYRIHNENKEETAFLKYNDNQNYSMYVLPSYELFTNGQQKDILQLAKDHSIFMRIELLPNNVDWNLLKVATDNHLTTLSKKTPVRTSLKEELWDEAVLHEVSNGQNIVTVYFISHQDINLRLTMYTNKSEDHRNAFYQMAKTILKDEE